MADVPLKEYIDQRMQDFERRLIDRFTLNDRRLDAMNEFREALKDQANRMATRVELEKLDGDVRELQRAKANYDGRVLVTVSVLSLVISIVISLGLWLLTRVAGK